MNSKPWLEVTWDGIPCFENTWVRNSWVSSRELMESWVGMKRDCLVRWLTITNIAVCPSDVGSCSMKSIEMDSHGHGDWQLFEEAIRFVSVCLGVCTYHAGLDVLFDHLSKSGPMVQSMDQVNGFVMAKMSHHWVVMVIVD